MGQTKQHRWQTNAQLERALVLCDAICDYVDDRQDNHPRLVSSTARLVEQFGLTLNEIADLSAELTSEARVENGESVG